MKKIYLAIPYSGMEESSFRQANEATVHLLNMGFNVFSPITHSHPLTRYNLPGTWDFWEQIDYQFLDWSDRLLVVIPEEGIDKVLHSKGVQAEIKYFENTYGKVAELIHFKDIFTYGKGNEI
jgi:hypothetical protein